MTHLTRRAAFAMAGLAATPIAAAVPDRKIALRPFACNLDTWFTEVPFADRFALAARAGFTQVEFWPVRRKDDKMDAARARALLDANGLVLTQYAPTAPNFSDPANHPALVAMIKEAIVDSATLGCKAITLVGHHLVDGLSREAMLSGYTAGLMRIAPLLEAAGLMALVEPFNTVNHIGHLLNGSRPATGIVRAVNSPMVKIQWDFYHMQLEDGDLIEKFTAGVDTVGYVQLGDVPGRYQPGTGEVNHVNLLKAIRAAGYKGPMGLEYFPLDKDNERAVREAVSLSQASGLV
ncbi:TIM barrel protein [Asticcacaulis sp. 201]|uniref:TIM barrel protein n=1 Tax=Asticcacaulis sp. 201 TaxID=3028787 RepID=UPI002916977E|nr:TIM barrel protein [Asticcacaulis sp. 201]MDV6333106.1 TIM barrel protein [Asticcacaulis sp. 201]